MPSILRSALTPIGLILAAVTTPALAAAPVLVDSFETAPTITNDRFEEWDAGKGPFSTGWTVKSGTVDIKHEKYFSDPTDPDYDVVYSRMAPDGVQFVDLNGSGPGWIQRSFNAVASVPYTLQFWYSGNPDLWDGSVSPRARTWVGSTDSATFTSAVSTSFQDLIAPPRDQPGFSSDPWFTAPSWDGTGIWRLATVNFTAPTTGLYYLNFEGLDVTTQAALALNKPFSGQGVMIDNVVLSAVPEPSTYALMLAGLGLVGWMAHRRRKATADASADAAIDGDAAPAPSAA